MRNIFLVFPFLLLLVSCSVHKERAYFCTSPHVTNQEIRGLYVRNTSQGWTRPDANTEVVPDIPHYQMIQLKRFRKFTFQSSHNHPENKWRGTWKKHQDTLELTFIIKRKNSQTGKKVKHTDRLLISHLTLTPLETVVIRAKTIGQSSFGRNNPYDNERILKRIKKFTECHPNGFLKESKRMIQINRFHRSETYLEYHGRQKYYDTNGKLIKIVRYRKGEILSEKEFSPNNQAN